MKMINVKIKLIDGGKMPRKGTVGAACYDCYAREDVILDNTKPKLIPLGFAMAIPEGYCAKIYPRSSTGLKTRIRMPNGTDIIDCDYRGEVAFIAELKHIDNNQSHVYIPAGERICQMMIEKVLDTEFEVVEELPETERGTNGYGSTGRA